MDRRRLLPLAGLLLLIFFLIVWWPDRLTDDEQTYVGTWQARGVRKTWSLTFTPDHRCLRRAPTSYPTESTGRWWVRNGRIYLDFETNPLCRALRPLLERLGLPVTPVGSADKDDFELMLVRSNSN